MSKVDAMRALREARRAAAAPSAPVAPRVAPRAPTATARAAQVDPSGLEAVPGLCGHRSMNGRSCTRDAGHAEKNHRYG